MNFLISASTDIGITKETNQDSLSIRRIQTACGEMVFAVLCDGMGGLAKGEVASASVIRAFERWLNERLPMLTTAELSDTVIRSQWEEIVREQNERIRNYGVRHNIQLGTTAVVMLLTQERYYIMNVGDSRAYEITDDPRQITADQTLIAREIAQGHLSEEQARNDPRKSVLLQCIGVSERVYPDMFFGDVRKDAVYFLCSDGFRHEITEQEIRSAFWPLSFLKPEDMKRAAEELISVNISRGETDNISVALVRTF